MQHKLIVHLLEILLCIPLCNNGTKCLKTLTFMNQEDIAIRKSDLNIEVFYGLFNDVVDDF